MALARALATVIPTTEGRWAFTAPGQHDALQLWPGCQQNSPAVSLRLELL